MITRFSQCVTDQVPRVENSPHLSSDIFQFEVTQRDEGHCRHNECEFVRQVTAIRSNKVAQRPDIPSLIHSHDERNNAETERSSGRKSNRKNLRVIPALQVVVGEFALGGHISHQGYFFTQLIFDSPCGI